MWSAQGQFESAKLWRLTHLLIGVPAAALAASAGVTALATTTGRVAAGIIALAAAAFAAVAATLDASKRAEAAETVGNKYLGLQSESTIARDVDLLTQSVEEARHALHVLAQRRQDVNQQAGVIPRIAYARAKRNIEREGGQTYQVDAPDQA